MAQDRKHKKLDDQIVQTVRDQVINGTGYRSPPAHTQFQKGKSGNPRGRPKKVPQDLSFSDIPSLTAALKVASTKVNVSQNGKPVEMTTYEATLQATAVAAMKGNARSAGLLFDLWRNAEEARVHEAKRRNEFWQAYQAVARQIIADAEAAGEEPPPILPHPDDIEFDPETGPRFLGPMTAECQARVDNTLKWREVLLMQDELDRRSKVRHNGEPLREPGAALLIAIHMEVLLPPRLRMSDADYFRAVSHTERMTKRELLKKLFEGWRRLGKPRPRGFIFPDRSKVVANLAFMGNFIAAASNGEIDTDALMRGQFDDNFFDFLERNGRSIEPFLEAREQAP